MDTLYIMKFKFMSEELAEAISLSVTGPCFWFCFLIKTCTCECGVSGIRTFSGARKVF
jgi:hypothetical protein